MRLASHLHLPLQEVQNKTTSTEFIEWLAYLDLIEEEDEKAFTVDRYYMAQIAAEVARNRVKNPNKIKIKDKQIKFVRKRNGKSNTADIEKSKAFWLGSLGLASTKKE